jgi:hypothetical protein
LQVVAVLVGVWLPTAPHWQFVTSEPLVRFVSNSVLASMDTFGDEKSRRDGHCSVHLCVCCAGPTLGVIERVVANGRHQTCEQTVTNAA